MKARFAVGLVLGAWMGMAGSAVAGALRPVDAAVILAGEARLDVGRMFDLARRVPDPTLRDRLIGSLGRVDSRLQTIQGLDAVAPVGPRVVVGPPPPPVTSEQELASILGAVAHESFSSDKLAMVRSATVGRWLTVEQVGRLMDAVTFSSDKLDVGAMLYPQIVDPQSWYLIFGRLTFSSDKDELRRRTSG